MIIDREAEPPINRARFDRKEQLKREREEGKKIKSEPTTLGEGDSRQISRNDHEACKSIKQGQGIVA